MAEKGELQPRLGLATESEPSQEAKAEIVVQSVPDHFDCNQLAIMDEFEAMINGVAARGMLDQLGGPTAER
eukprot:14441451-Alexandrium_andersonii.AAC.1